MIAYNLCYTTCLGNLNDGFRDGKKRFGVSNTNIGFQVREDQVHVTPNNVCFLKKSVKQGIIPQILSEFLQTRIMIKKSSGLYRDNVEI
jgi:DNA polymerase zeta